MYAITATSFRAIDSIADALDGETAVEEVPSTVLAEIKRGEARGLRNERLRASDWTQVGDSKVTGTEKAAWQAYRQALRDLPQAAGWPNVPWPDPPPLSDTSAGTVKP